jgi:hypothetical protein
LINILPQPSKTISNLWEIRIDDVVGDIDREIQLAIEIARGKHIQVWRVGSAFSLGTMRVAVGGIAVAVLN